jgi:hypothetical protein
MWKSMLRGENADARRYPTPLETLLSLPHAQQYLRPEFTLATLKRIRSFTATPKQDSCNQPSSGGLKDCGRHRFPQEASEAREQNAAPLPRAP